MKSKCHSKLMRAVGVLAFICIATLLCVRPAHAQAPAPAKVTIQAVPMAGGAAQSQSGRRIAMFLIDCSNSMYCGVNDSLPISAVNPQRWREVRKALELNLHALWRSSPGIEVEIRFFATQEACMPDIRGSLTQDADVGVLMSGIPEQAPMKGDTALYDAIGSSLQLLLSRLNEGYEWAYFAVVSDGADTKSKDTQGWRASLDKLKARGAAFSPVVGVVGPQAQALALESGFGTIAAVAIDKLVPTPPPPPRPRYRISAVPADQRISSAATAKSGARLSVSCQVTSSDHTPLTGMLLRITADTKSGLVVVDRNPIPVGPNGVAMFAVDLPPGVDFGVAGVVTIEAMSAPNASADFNGAVLVPISYPASGILSPSEWKFDHPQSVKRFDPASFAATLGIVKQAQWLFDPPEGHGAAQEQETGSAVAHTFATAGRWKVKVSATSEAGMVLGPKSCGDIDVVDADFDLQQPPQGITAGSDAAITINRRPGADSPATFSAKLDGNPIAAPLIVGDKKIKLLELSPGGHTLSVDATSTVGKYLWSRQLSFNAAVAPAIQIIGPVHVKECEKSIQVGVRVSGDVGPQLLVTLDETKQNPVSVVYPEQGPRIVQVPVDIPLSNFKGPSVTLLVEPSKKGSCEPGQTVVSMVRADLHVELVSYGNGLTDGASLKGNGTEPIKLVLSGEDAVRCADVDILVRIDNAGASVELKANKASDWTCTVPSGLRSGSHKVSTQLSGGSLRPIVFPRGWDQLGARGFDILPPALMIVQIPANPGGLTTTPGKQVIFGLTVVPAGNVVASGVTWTLKFNGKLVPISGGATVAWTPPSWGTISLDVVAPMTDGTELKAHADIPVQGNSPTIQPKLSDDTPPQGTRLIVTPAVSGEFASLGVELWECDRSGKRVANLPAWKSQEYQTDPGSVDIPLSPDLIGRNIEFFEVEVFVKAYPGDPKPTPLPVRLGGRVVPPALWHWWGLCVLAMAVVAWLLWKLLRENEPLRWELEFSSRNPGPASDEGAEGLSTLWIKEKRKHTDDRLSYKGWSRRSKEAFVPLWCLREQTDDLDLDWLQEVGNLNIRVKSFWANPMDRVPGPNEGWAEADQTAQAVEGEIRFSCTKRLRTTTPTGVQGMLYVRMRCPRGRDPLMWILWLWGGLSAVGSALLLQYFHIVNF
jgi:hypothetical protein